MNLQVFYGILIPFLGTTLGAAMVIFMKGKMPDKIRRNLTGFAGGVMVAASIWSLILPALEESQPENFVELLPVVGGFWAGILFLLLLDQFVPHLHFESDRPEGISSEKLKKTTMLVFAVVLHNIPEGMAVGVMMAGWQASNEMISYSAAMALSIGIALQNFPEGAIISMPLHAEGMGKGKAFWYGMLSGAVEPVASVLTMIAASLVVPALPALLSFAAGAMIYVVVEELIPEASAGSHSNMGTIFFAIGFTLMMILDVML